MVGAQNILPCRKYAFKKRLGLGKAALVLIYRRQIVCSYECFGVFGA